MAFTYRNGRVPSSRLVTFATGWLPGEGTWKHQLPPATYRKHLALVALAKKHTGRTLKVSEGWGAYRPYETQVYAKSVHGIWAATPGTSSHGMFWEGRQCAAIDYGNWGAVYNWDRAAFFRDVRAVGMEPGLISKARGYPDEPWHVVDLDPWAAVPAGGAVVTPRPKDEEEGLDMSQIRYVHRVEKDYKTEWMIAGMELPGGYMTTSDETTAVGWGALYGTDKGDSWKALSRKEYVQLQTTAKDLNRRWVAQMKAISR